MSPAERPGGDRHRAERAARRLALAAIFEAEFGQRTAPAILERHLAESEGDPATAEFARRLVAVTVERRDRIDELLGRLAPQYPVVQLARIDRALLRTAIGEVLHSATTPARVAIAEWVELARIYSGEPARRLVNGVLGRIARGGVAAGAGPEAIAPATSGPGADESEPEEGVSGHDLRATQEDRRRAARRR
ncbi:MAG TPA: transcription antitermination factor NusB [Candidatus Limnocylindrales bacterium]